MILNILGVSIAARFELCVTLLAIAELLIFMAVVAPGFQWSHFIQAGWAGQDHFQLSVVPGLFAALPFAIWFFLAIEGAAMAAEEAKTPRRTIPIAYLAGMLTLIILATGVMLFAGGVGDWRLLANINDPLPQAMKRIVGRQSNWLSMLVWLGLFGLIASFHAIIMSYSRQIFALARAGFLPPWLAALHPRFKTPHRAIVVGGVVGMATIFSDRLIVIAGQPLTAQIVTLAVFGALLMYIISMLALFKLRRDAPALARPFRVPAYPWLPAIALILAIVFLVAMVYYNRQLAAVFAVLLVLGSVYFRLTSHRHGAVQTDAMLEEPLRMR